MNENEVELNDLMIARADVLDNCIYQMILTVLEIKPEDAEKELPWDVSLIREVIYAVTDVLAQHGKYGCDPYVEHKEGKAYLCSLKDCGCKVCTCQENQSEKGSSHEGE